MKKSRKITVTVNIDGKYCGGWSCNYFLFGNYAHNRGDLECSLFGRLMLMHDGEKIIRCKECLKIFGMHETNISEQIKNLLRRMPKGQN